MTDPDLQERLDFALKTCDRIADFQRRFSRGELRLQRKGDDSPVTIADQESERMFREAVADAFPNDRVFGEEDGGADLQPPRWVIDPIDGTRKFMRGLPFWAICIAFEGPDDMEIGIVDIPAANIRWYALRGKGCFRNDQKVQVSQEKQDLKRSILTMPGRTFFEDIGREDVFDRTQREIEHDPGFLDAYSYGFIADGRLHGLISCADKWWDIAAPIAIVREAGGLFTSCNGGKPQEVQLNIAAAPHTHELIMKLIGDA